jgi:hypothetical protein
MYKIDEGKIGKSVSVRLVSKYKRFNLFSVAI